MQRLSHLYGCEAAVEKGQWYTVGCSAFLSWQNSYFYEVTFYTRPSRRNQYLNYPIANSSLVKYISSTRTSCFSLRQWAFSFLLNSTDYRLFAKRSLTINCISVHLLSFTDQQRRSGTFCFPSPSIAFWPHGLCGALAGVGRAAPGRLAGVSSDCDVFPSTLWRIDKYKKRNISLQVQYLLYVHRWFYNIYSWLLNFQVTYLKSK